MYADWGLVGALGSFAFFSFFSLVGAICVKAAVASGGGDKKG